MKKNIEEFVGKEVRIVFKDGMVREGVLGYDSWLEFYTIVGSKGVMVFSQGAEKKIKVLK